MRKVKKYIFTLPLSSFPQAWAAWCGQSYAPCGRRRVRQALDFTMEPRTDLSQFQADPWTLGISLHASANSGPSLTLASANFSGLSGPCSLGQHIHHQAPHKSRPLVHPYSCQLLRHGQFLRPQVAPRTPGCQWTLAILGPQPAPPHAKCWLASMTQGASYGSRLSKKLGFEAMLLAHLGAIWIPWQLSWHQAPSGHLWIQAPSWVLCQASYDRTRLLTHASCRPVPTDLDSRAAQLTQAQGARWDPGQHLRAQGIGWVLEPQTPAILLGEWSQNPQIPDWVLQNLAASSSPYWLPLVESISRSATAYPGTSCACPKTLSSKFIHGHHQVAHSESLDRMNMEGFAYWSQSVKTRRGAFQMERHKHKATRITDNEGNRTLPKETIKLPQQILKK